MKHLPLKKPIPARRLPKTDRQQAVLVGLIELYLKTGKPIGSHTLQESGFESLSSATIRNYFSKMEESGFLAQQHTSGGRIPTEKALRLYVDLLCRQGTIEAGQEKLLEEVFQKDSREVAALLHFAAERLSEMTKCAVFISAPRFDQDFVQEIKMIRLDEAKLLSVLITNFGLIHTETIYTDLPISDASLRTIEEYFLWRMGKGEKPLFQNEAEAKSAQRIYNEIMVRHIVGYATFRKEDILRTGLSKLLAYPEFSDAASLASSLALLEDDAQMRTLLQESCKTDGPSCWIGDELCPSLPKSAECSVIAIPYKINQTIAGAVALLGPTRLPYRNLFGLVEAFSQQMSRALTQSVYKYKINFRRPAPPTQLEDQSR